MAASDIPTGTVLEARACTVLRNLVESNQGATGGYLLPANVCPVVPLTLLTAGRAFEFVDIDPVSLCMDPLQAMARVSSCGQPKVAGVLYVRTYGFEQDATALFQQLKQLDPGLLLIDDRCLARPEPDAGALDWQGADVVIYSSGYGKYVDLGYGGFAHLRKGTPYSHRSGKFARQDLAAVTALYRSHVRQGTPIYRTAGDATDPRSPTPDLWEHRHWLQTARPRVDWAEYRRQLIRKRGTMDSLKAEHNALYSEIIPKAAQLPARFHWWRFQIKVPAKVELLRKIFAAGEFASDHFFPASLLFGGRTLPVAARLRAEIVNLFNDGHVTREQVVRVARIVGEHLSEQDLRGDAGISPSQH